MPSLLPAWISSLGLPALQVVSSEEVHRFGSRWMMTILVPQNPTLRQLVVGALRERQLPDYAHDVADLVYLEEARLAGGDDVDEVNMIEGLADDLARVAGQPREVFCLAAVHGLGSALRARVQESDPASTIDLRLRRLAQVCPHADWVATYRALAAKTVQPWLAEAMASAQLVTPARLMDPAAIRATDKGKPGVRWNQAKRDLDPSLPDYWSARLTPEATVTACVDLLRAEPVTSLGELAAGLSRALELRYPASSGPLRPHLGAVAGLLCERREADKRESDQILTEQCWDFCRFADASVETRHLESLGALALEELGRLRVRLRSAADGRPEHLPEDVRLHLTAAISFLLRLKRASLWDVLRRLVLALHALPVPCVLPDLRTWEEQGKDKPPEPWGWVPREIARVLEVYLGQELVRDPKLDELRREFAAFLLDRLKTKDKRHGEVLSNEDLVEPNPKWREAMIVAVKELRANPGGRGHNMLAWCQRHDPDGDVRAAARSALSAVRHAGRLPDDISPRRPLWAAFWVLRQGHLRALGVEPDREAAERTLWKEVRRSRTVE